MAISFLNDFIFCPRSIYFHQLYRNFHMSVYTQTPQMAGLAAHKSIDQKKYSTSKHILQGLDCYSAQFKLCGKIDLFDKQNHLLIERKREIKKIYDGYIFQLYAQYYCLIEMGFIVNHLQLRDLVHNKNYPIPLPEEAPEYQLRFTQLIEKIHQYDLFNSETPRSLAKCTHCIYNPLCDYSLC